MQRISILLSSMLLITGCIKKPVTPELNFGRYYFGYEVAGKGAKDIVQVFDDGEVTYLQLRQPILTRRPALIVTDETGQILEFEQGNLFNQLKGIYETLQFEDEENSRWNITINRK